MEKKVNNPENEGHVQEWQDRARVVLDAKKAVGDEGSPKQSPEEDVEEKSNNLDKERGNETSY